MNKQENKLALSVLTTLISGIALIYTLIMYHNIIFAVMGMSLLFLICAYVLTQNIIAFSVAKNKYMNSQLKDYINDISEQLENMSGAQSQLGKATFLYTKQAAQTVAMLETNYMESQDTLHKNLASISNMQNKATKLMIKYDQNNTTKVISTIKELRNQLSDTMIQGFDQIQPNNDEVVSALEDIVNYLKTQPTVPDQTLSLQLNNVAHELQNISNNIQHFQVPVQATVAPATVSTADSATDTVVHNPEDDLTKTSLLEDIATEELASSTTDSLAEDFINEDLFAEDITTNDTDTSVVEELSSDTTSSEDVTLADISLDTSFAEEDIASYTEESPSDTDTTVTEELTLDDPNKQLSADEIAALFAAAEPAPKKEVEATIEEKEVEEPFTPTFTVVGKSTEYEEPETAEEPMTIGDLSEDPNKQLSADEIAALFAAADPAPKKAEAPVENMVSAEPVLDDPNKQLSADEIAALFAAAEPAPKKDPIEEEKQMDAAIANAEPTTVTPVSDDPNKQLSADEIAALFASLG